MTTLRPAALITGPDTYLDHIGVLSYIMKMPLFITEESTFLSAQTFYPQLKPIYKEADELDSSFLASQFDVLFDTCKFLSVKMAPVIELLHHKKMRFVYCPHGNSDKGHSRQTLFQDISLVYGDHMIDLLTQTTALEKINKTVRTGNYRLPFYLKYKSFYDSLTHNLVTKHLDAHKKTILYAPTWQDGESISSFFSSTGRLVEDLSKEFNLLIKLHPFLKQFHPAQTENILQRYNNRSGIVFLDSFPAIYPLLQISDLYIGDYSSIGYDFLAFDRPLYFLKEETTSPSAILPCGMCIPNLENIREFIQKSFHQNQLEKSQIRKAVYKYAFGEEIPFEQLKKNILESFETSYV